MRFEYFSKENEEGYSGYLRFVVEYILKNDDFYIRYKATSNVDTIVHLQIICISTFLKDRGRGDILSI